MAAARLIGAAACSDDDNDDQMEQVVEEEIQQDQQFEDQVEEAHSSRTAPRIRRVPPMAFDDLTGQFVSLTTFRRDGTPVPTTVWFARDGDHAIVGTAPEAGKVKRIRTNPQVTLERSNYRGKTKGGTISAGSARILEGKGAARAHDTLSSKYGWQWRFAGGRIETYLEISPAIG